jgi:uncharacterized repeat protein (TIGR01451 family)
VTQRPLLAVALAAVFSVSAFAQPRDAAPPVVVATKPVVAPEEQKEAAADPGAGRTPAAVTVEVTGPGQVTPGETLAATVVVRNVGGAVAAQVRVELPLPADAKFLAAEPAAVVQGGRLVWGLGNLEAGGERRLRAELRAGTGGEWLLTPAVAHAGGGLRTRVEKPAFAVTQDAPESARRGEKVAIRIQVANHGTQPLRRVLLRDRLPAGLRHDQGGKLQVEIPELAAGEVKTVPLEVVAAEPGRQVNEVEAVAEGLPTARSRATVLVADAGLELRLSGPEKLDVGQEADWRVELVNGSGQPSAAGRLLLRVPAGVEAAAASGSAGREAGALTWDLEPLGPGQARTLVVRLKGRTAGAWTLEAGVSGGAGELHRTAAVRVEGVTRLGLETTARDDPLAVGGETVYEARLFNRGTAPARDVRLAVTAPEGLEVLAADGPTAGRAEGGVASFEPLPELPPRGEALYRLRVRARQPGAGRLRLEVKADGLAAPVSDELLTHVVADGAKQGAEKPPG